MSIRGFAEFLWWIWLLVLIGCGDFILSPEEARAGKLDACDDIEHQMASPGSLIGLRALEAEFNRLGCGLPADQKQPEADDG